MFVNNAVCIYTTECPSSGINSSFPLLGPVKLD